MKHHFPLKVTYGSKTYLTPLRKHPEQKDGPTDIYIENYSKDPEVAASQAMEQMQNMAQTGEAFVYGRSRFHDGKDLPNDHGQLQTKPENRDHIDPRKKTKKFVDKQ